VGGHRPGGDEGAHQVSNKTDAPIRVLMLSTLIAPDLVHYPDQREVRIAEREG